VTRAEDITGLKLPTVGGDVIRRADILHIRAMLDRYTECYFMRLPTPKYSNNHQIPHKLDGMDDVEAIPTLDNWTTRTSENVWVLEDEVEQSLTGDLEVMAWYEEEYIRQCRSHINENHG
jgi:hypothetical protein